MKEIEITIKNGTIVFPVPSTAFVPDYLKYVLLYKGIPPTLKLQFTDKTFKNLKEFQDAANNV